MATVMKPGWRARLELGFERRAVGAAFRTVPTRRRHHGPLVVQRPFHPEGEVCHSLILHPPGGLVGGDELDLEVDCAPGAHALLTTPGAGKCYRSAGPPVRVRQRLRLAPGAALEWLPQEVIVYDGAAFDSLTCIELARGARFAGWEIACLGRPAAGEAFARGRCRQRVEVWRDGEPLLVERLDAAGAAPLLYEPWGLAGAPVSALLLAVPADAALRDAALAAGGDDPGFSATLLDEVLAVRYLGGGARGARACLEAVWEAIRPPLLGRAPDRPRIWNT